MPNRSVLITGGTRGIGRATALHLAQKGYDLVLGYVRGEQAAAMLRHEVHELGRECVTVCADLTTDAGVEDLFSAATREGKSVDVVVNNAGATLHVGPLTETPVEIVRRTIDLNLTAAVLVARRAVQVLPVGGVLVNVSSGAATTGAPGEYVHYAAAKAGVDALTKGLAIEAVEHGIRVVGVAPGTINTDVHTAAGDPGRIERVARRHPMHRVGEPEEVAAVISFAISDEASYVSGTTLRVSGGL